MLSMSSYYVYMSSHDEYEGGHLNDAIFHLMWYFFFFVPVIPIIKYCHSRWPA